MLKASGLRSPKVITLGSSAGLSVGQPVVALGAPLGLSSSVTTGIVSALGRTIQVPGLGGQSALLVDAIQTDAAINPGNSGGALTDCGAKLVGVPTAGATVPNASGQQSAGNIGIGFANPVDLAKLVSDEIISTGGVSHADFGPPSLPRRSIDGARARRPLCDPGPHGRPGQLSRPARRRRDHRDRRKACSQHRPAHRVDLDQTGR